MPPIQIPAANREDPELRARKGSWPPPPPPKTWIRQLADVYDNEVSPRLDRIPWYLRWAVPLPENSRDWAGMIDAATTAVPPAKLASMPLLAASNPRYQQLLRKILKVELPGKLRLARLQHVDDPVFAAHESRGLVFTMLPHHIRRSTLPPSHMPADPSKYRVVTSTVELKNPLLMPTGELANVIVRDIDPDLDRALGLLPFSHDGPPTTMSAEEILRHIIQTGENPGLPPWYQAGWNKIPISKRKEAAKHVLPALQNFEARTNWRPLYRAAPLVGYDRAAADIVRKGGFDSIIAVDNPRHPHGRSLRIHEIALVPTETVEVVRRGEDKPVKLLVRPPVRR